MKKIILIFSFLYGLCPLLFAQRPDWIISPNKINFTTTSASSPIPLGGLPSTPHYAANCGYDGFGNILFTIVDGNVYNNIGIFAGNLATAYGYNGKNIIIIPDPADCKASLVIHSSTGLLPGTGCHHVNKLLCTRITYIGSSLTIQPNYYIFPGGLSNCSNASSMCISKPKTGGSRYLYYADDGNLYKYEISTTGITLANTKALTGINVPTDLELSPTEDKIAFSNAAGSVNFNIKWVYLNGLGNFQPTINQFNILPGSASRAFGLEFISNTHAMMAVDNSIIGGIYLANLIASTSTQIVPDGAYKKSQLETALDGKVYAAENSGLLGINTFSSYTTNTISLPVSNSFAFNTFNYFSLPKDDTTIYCPPLPPCPPDVIISGTYATPLTESSTWIKSVGTTTITPTANVKLDGDPVNGYVELNPYFFSCPTSGFFIAQCKDGCGPQTPQFRVMNVDALLQGYCNSSSTMVPTLMNQGMGSDSSLTDWVNIELRNKSAPFDVVAYSLAKLHTDGSLESFEPPTISDSFYIVVKNRNTLETWSAAPVAIAQGTTTYNFTTSASKSYGSNQIEVAPNLWAIYSGDINQDENIDLADFSLLELDINNFEFGYKATDINGDGSVDLQDVPLVELNSNMFIFSNHP